MKRLVLFALAFLNACGPKAIAPFHPVKAQFQKLPSGMEVLLLEDHELPLVDLFIYIRGGSLLDPEGKEGLSSLAIQTIRLGGIEKRIRASGGGFPTVASDEATGTQMGGAGGERYLNPDEIEDELESVGASLEMGTTREYQTASLSLLKKDLKSGLEILFGLLQHPSLDPSRLEIVRARAQDDLESRMEDPLDLAYLEYPRLIYGEKSPWGRRPTRRSLDRIVREDLVSFHRQMIRPDRMILAAAGDFSSKDLLNLLGQMTQGWELSTGPLPSIPPVQQEFREAKVVLPQKELTQSTILMGHLGEKRHNQDKFPLLVMNFILGGSGSLTSRLGEEIRSAAGKAYGVWSDFGFGSDYGIFRAVSQTALENTDWVLERMKEIIQKASERPGFEETEIRRAKETILRSLFFDFETRFSQVKEQAKFRIWGYPEDYLTLFQKEIARTTKKDLERVAKKYLHPDGFKILVVTSEESAKNLVDFKAWDLP